MDAEDIGQITIEDLGQLVTDDIKEVRAYAWPAARCRWRIKEATLVYFERALEGKPEKTRVPGVTVVIECVEPLDITDTDPQFASMPIEDLVGREFTHRISFMNGPDDGLGRVKAFMIDTGFTPPPGRRFGDQLHEWVGTQFEGSLNKRRDKNNSDIVYTNLNTMAGQIKPAA